MALTSAIGKGLESVGGSAGPDFAAVTGRLQQVWSAGDFHVIAIATMAAAEMLVDAVDPRAGERVLDVACGSGNVALVAARRHCEVTGIDYVPSSSSARGCARRRRAPRWTSCWPTPRRCPSRTAASMRCSRCSG